MVRRQAWLAAFLVCLYAVVFACSEDLGARVVTYPAPAGVPAADDYRVWANGKEVFVYYSPVAAIAAFDCEGEVDVTVAPARDVKWVDIRPLSKGIKATVQDGKFSFRLAEPCNLSVELNGEILRHPLYVFANPIEQNAPEPNDDGVRYFEAGKVHDAGGIELKSGETIYIAGGAVVRGRMMAERAQDVTIRGRGILDCKPLEELDGRRWRRPIGLTDCRDVEVEGIILADSTTWQIVPYNCDGVAIRNVKLVSDDGSDDGIDIVSSRNVTLDDCFIHTKDDCIVIKSWGGRVKYPSEPVPPGPNVENVHVRNCVLWNAAWGNGLEIGFELRSRFIKDIVFENCDIIHVEDGAVLSIHNGDYATVQNVRFENIRIEDATQKLFDVAIFRSRYSVDRAEDWESAYLHGAWDGVLKVPADKRAEHAVHRGHIKDIVFKDIRIVDGRFPFSIFAGYDDDHLVENVTIDGLWVHGRKITDPKQAKFYTEYTKNIKFVK